jgi:hypothetical protein
MHPDSIILDFEKDNNGNITRAILTTIANGEILSCVDVPYNVVVIPAAELIDSVVLYKQMQEFIFQNQVQKEIQELIK